MEIYIFVKPNIIEAETYGYQHFYFIPIIFFGLMIDFILQRMINRYLILVILEIIFITGALVLNQI
jgi:hypothetical protein